MLHSKYLPGRFARQSYGAPLVFAPSVAPAASWSVDATSGIAVPSSSAEWSSFISAKGLSIAVPDALWLLQEASGNAADTIGAFALTASGTGLAYQQAVSGWSRKAITFTDGGTGALKSTSASLPDISTTSQLTLLYALVTAPASARQVIGQGTTLDQLQIANTSVMRVRSASNTADGVASATGSVRPWAIRTNRTAGSCVGFTDAEKVTPAFSATVTGKGVCFGANPSNSPPMSALYAVEWHGANAEMTDATLKALEQALGFTILW